MKCFNVPWLPPQRFQFVCFAVVTIGRTLRLWRLKMLKMCKMCGIQHSFPISDCPDVFPERSNVSRGFLAANSMRTVYFSHPDDWNTFRELVKLRFRLFVSSSETLASLKISSFPELRESHVVLHRRHRPLRRPARRLDGCLVSTVVYSCAAWRRRLGCRAEMGIVGRIFFSTWSQGIEAKCSGWLVSRQGRARVFSVPLGVGWWENIGDLWIWDTY